MVSGTIKHNFNINSSWVRSKSWLLLSVPGRSITVGMLFCFPSCNAYFSLLVSWTGYVEKMVCGQPLHCFWCYWSLLYLWVHCVQDGRFWCWRGGWGGSDWKATAAATGYNAGGKHHTFHLNKRIQWSFPFCSLLSPTNSVLSNSDLNANTVSIASLEIQDSKWGQQHGLNGIRAKQSTE